jgi:integrase
MPLSMLRPYGGLMAVSTTSRRLRAKELRGIRQRGQSYQVRVFGGIDPLTGKDVYLTGSAQTERDAIRLRDRLRSEVAENRSTRTSGTLGHLLREWLDQHPGEKETVDDYRFLAESFIIPALGSVKLTRLTHPGPSLIEKFYAELRRCRRRCDGKPFVEHRKGCRSDSDPGFQCDGRCKQHACKPLGGSTLRHIHVVLNGAFKAAVRWGWIGVNPLDMIPKPRAPKPQPNPPSAANAARIIDKAWATDAEWGTFVWLTMVTGARRGELVALRFSRVELSCRECGRSIGWLDDKCRTCGSDLAGSRTATLELRRNYSARKKDEKDTKTHQIRRISLDGTTAGILVAQYSRYADRVLHLGGQPREDAYIFSYAADNSRPCSPDGLTHRYSRMTASLGLDTHIHELRHYSATELLAAGVDLRTVAGRLGHAGGGVTTLRVYAAWVRSADEQAAALLAERLTGGLPSSRPADERE